MLLHDKLWTIKKCCQKNVAEFVDNLGISKITAKLLLNRGINDVDMARAFLEPKLDNLNAPFLLKDMDSNNKLHLQKDKLIEENNNFATDKSLTHKDLFPTLEIDMELDIKDIGFNLIEEIERLAPFGADNPKPLFSYKNIIVESVNFIGKDNEHLKLLVQDEKRVFDCIGLNLGKEHMTLSKGEKIDLVFSLELSTFKGIETIQFNIMDLRRRSAESYKENELIFNYYCSFTKILSKFEYEQREFNFENAVDLRNIKDRTKYIIESVDFDSSNLILVNTMEGLIDLSLFLSDIGMFDLLEAISFNVPKDDYKDVIVVNPVLNDFNFEEYENIYIYDMPIIKEEIDVLLSSSSKIYFLYNNDDTESVKKFLDNVVPNRNDLAEIYKYFKQSLGNNQFSYQSLIKDLSTINCTKLNFCLEILSDSDLINYCQDREKLNIELLPPPKKKIDITATKLYEKINSIRKHFKNYSKAAFTIEFK